MPMQKDSLRLEWFYREVASLDCAANLTDMLLRMIKANCKKNALLEKRMKVGEVMFAKITPWI